LRIQAVRTLRGHGGRESRVALLSLLADPHPGVRAAVREEIVRRPPSEGPELAREISKLRLEQARIEGLRAVLERREDPTPFAADTASAVRARALSSGRVALAQAGEALKSSDPVTRAHALECLRDNAAAARMARDRAGPPRIAAARVTAEPDVLRPLLRDPSWRVRLAAMRACARMRRKEFVPELIRMLEGSSGRVRAGASDLLEDWSGAPFGEDATKWREWWANAKDGFEIGDLRPKRAREDHSRAIATFRRIPVRSLRLCFVLDASRSMSKPAPGANGKSRWELVVRDLRDVLRKLPRQARFNVILFRTGVEAWKPRLVGATRSAKAACLRWIEAQDPGGWTNLFDALEVALRDDDVDALFVLTDGVPSRGKEKGRRAILKEIAFLNHYRLVQINCVQAGSEKGLSKSWRGFLDELAEAHDGVSVRE
jgi:hypothetical protein